MGRTLSRNGRKWARRRGQALVETALVMPLVLLVLVGIMEIGHAWNIHQVMTDAARQGARTAAILNNSGLTPSEVRDSARVVAQNALTAGSVKFDPNDITVGAGPNHDVDTVTVEVVYPFFVLRPVMRLAGQSFDGPVTLKSSAVMRNE